MLRKIEIENYKSISKLPIELGRVNVFIGENGAGKSNILEAIALASAAASEKLDNEFLAARGIRVTHPKAMRAGFEHGADSQPISVTATYRDNEVIRFVLQNENLPYARWTAHISHPDIQYIPSGSLASVETGLTVEVRGALQRLQDLISETVPGQDIREILNRTELRLSINNESFKNFLIYSPENSALRAFEREGQIEPLGINGEGLLKLIHVHVSMAETTVISEIKEALQMLGWFEDFFPSADITDERLLIKDRYLQDLPFDLDQKSANEGFLFLLFYFALFTSKLTPKFFAVDNIDASLNPKLCEKLTKELVRLSAANDKQVIVTTHNPAILDGLNLDDDEQRLFVVSRSRNGSTKLTRIRKPADDGPAYRLSELFLRGMLGGLPKGF